MLEQLAIDQVKKALRKSIDNQEIAGANMMVIKKGEELFYHEDGFADREAGQRIQRDSIFRLSKIGEKTPSSSV